MLHFEHCATQIIVVKKKVQKTHADDIMCVRFSVSKFILTVEPVID